MDKFKMRIIKRFETFIAICLISAALTACNAMDREADWEDTLPTVSSRKTTEVVQVILEETYPTTTETEATPLPETTTVRTAASLTEPPLATSTGSVDEDDEELYDFSPVPIIPSIPVSEYTQTTASLPDVTTIPAVSESIPTSQSSETVSSVQRTDDIVSEIKKRNIERPYSYMSLNTVRKYVYDVLINAIEFHKTELTIPASVNVSDGDYKEVYQQLYNDENTIFYIGTLINYSNNGGNKNIVIQYKYSKEEIDRMEWEINAAADLILSKINDDMTEYDIVKLFFDELAGNCVYDASAPNCSDLYGCLVNKKAICGGFSKAFSYLCSRAGIESLIITGDFEVPHMWNMVKIDSEWYHIDVTAGIVKNSATQYVRYDYFCVTDEFIKKTRAVYPQEYSYPAAIYNTFNYFTLNKLVADSYAKAESIFYESVIKATKDKSETIQFACSSAEVFDEVVKKFFDNSSAQALNILDSAYIKAANKYNRESIKYNQDRQTLVIKVFIEYLD